MTAPSTYDTNAMAFKPCPFCEGTDIRCDKHHESRSPTGFVWSMCCYQCGATFPNRYKRELLVEGWNRRPAYRAITGPSEESTQICTSDRTAVWSQAVEACAKVAENYVPGPAGHPYEHVKHDICVGIARKLRSLYLSPERVREVYPDLQKPSHAEQTAGGSNLQSTSEPTNAMAPGFYGCRLPPGGCGCPQDVRHKCRHAHWVTSGEPCR
jgi:Lar family restriction alleviation protein